MTFDGTSKIFLIYPIFYLLQVGYFRLVVSMNFDVEPNTSFSAQCGLGIWLSGVDLGLSWGWRCDLSRELPKIRAPLISCRAKIVGPLFY